MAWYDKYTRKGSTLGSLASLAPGGAKADFGGAAKAVKNAAGEISGAYDIGRGLNQIATSGILPGGKKADFTRAGAGLLNTLAGASSFIPVGGAAIRVAAKGVQLSAKALKAEKALAKTTSAIAKQTPTFTKAAQGATNAANYANKKLVTSVIPPKYTNKLPGGVKQVVKAATTPIVPITAARFALTGGSDATTSQSTANQTAGTSPTVTTDTTGTVGNNPTNAGSTTGGTAGSGSGNSRGVGTTAPVVTAGTTAGSTQTSLTETPEARQKRLQAQLDAMPAFSSLSSTGTPAVTGTPLPGAVSAEAAQYGADLASAAERSYAGQAALREQLSQNMIKSSGLAADIYGGRSPAIMGQATTGGQRDFVTGMSAQAAADLTKEAALAKGYSSNITKQYETLASNALKRTRATAEGAAKIKALGQ